MGVLTETMMRLRKEIGAWRHKRVVLQHDLARQTKERRIRVSATRAAFALDRAGAHSAWFGPMLSERQTAERRQQRLAEEAETKTRREQQSPATATSQPQRHNRAKPVPAPAARPRIALFAKAQRPPLKGSKKH